MIAAVLAFGLAATVAQSANTAGRGAQGGCASVTDARGGSVAGSAGGTAVGSRYSRECADVSTSSSSTRPSAPPRPQRPKEIQSATPVREPQTPPRTPIVSGQVRPAEPTEQPAAALRGDLVWASATVVTGGLLIWLIQSSLWTSLLVLGVPIWRHVDLLPIVDRLAADAGQRPSDSESPEEAAVEDLLARAPRRSAAGDVAAAS